DPRVRGKDGKYVYLKLNMSSKWLPSTLKARNYRAATRAFASGKVESYTAPWLRATFKKIRTDKRYHDRLVRKLGKRHAIIELAGLNNKFAEKMEQSLKGVL